MKAKGVTIEQLYDALANTNSKYAWNIAWAREPERYGNMVRFTLKVVSSKEPGHRRGFRGQRLAKACWHVHGDLFEAIFKIAPDAVIYSGTQKITKEAGNWEDRNIGSMMSPLYFSEACDCA